MHLGIADAVKSQMLSTENLPGELQPQLNCDGTTFFPSFSMRLWPSLAPVIEPFCSTVVPVGFHCGLGKPPDVSIFLKQTVSELVTLMNEGFKVGSVSANICFSSIVCDIADLAFIRQVKSPIGYYGFDKCIRFGQYCGKRVTCRDVKSELRDGCSSCMKVYPRHHIGVPAFLTITMHIIGNFFSGVYALVPF